MKKVFYLLVFLAYLFVPPTVQAKDVYPDNGSYKYERLKEKVGLMLKFNVDKKAEHIEQLLEKRLKELEYIGTNKQLFYLETTASRYSATAGQLTEIVIKKKLNNRKSDVIKLFESHKPRLEKIRNLNEHANSEWRMIQYDIESLDIYKQQMLDAS